MQVKRKEAFYMPGYYVHLATCRPEMRKIISFVHGVEAPDILKKYFKLYGLSGAKEKYNSTLKTASMPDFQQFEERIQRFGYRCKVLKIHGSKQRKIPKRTG